MSKITKENIDNSSVMVPAFKKEILIMAMGAFPALEFLPLAGSVKVYYNGVHQDEGSMQDYTVVLSGSPLEAVITPTLTGDLAGLVNGDEITVEYSYLAY
jgi:hypothetical protein